jgi:hypothetical protein
MIGGLIYMSYKKMRPRRGTGTEWTYDNPTLAEGEIGIESPSTGVGTGLVNVKFGDGVTPWKNLPYAIYNTKIDSDIKALYNLVQELRDDMSELQEYVATIDERLSHVEISLVTATGIDYDGDSNDTPK